MFDSLTVENYRGFQHYEMRNLGRVNLLVGKNDSGKTSMLEAVQTLATVGSPRAFLGAAKRRGEVDHGKSSDFLEMSHFFHGHQINRGSRFILSSRQPDASVVVSVEDIDQASQSDPPFNHHEIEPAEYHMKVEVKWQGELGQWKLPLSRQGMGKRRSLTSKRLVPSIDSEAKNVLFVAADAGEPRGLGKLWNLILEEAAEDQVAAAMQILQPDIEDVVFKTNALSRRVVGKSAGILVTRRPGTAPRRVPLGSYGDGMLRLLVLTISLINCRNGVLLVDEIDTGLHHSVMTDMWRLVVTTAQRSNIQVFATTHSHDCLRGLATLCEQEPELAREVSLQKIEPELDHSVSFSDQEIVIAAQQDIEVR